MTWGKVSDELHDDEKWRAATKSARALWVTALSWSASKGNGGRVPSHMLAYLDGSARDAACLVEVGLWDRDGRGFRFHDWDDYNEPEEAADARKARRSVAGMEANHRRWHVARGIRSASCPICIASDSDRSTDRSTGIRTDSDMNPPVPGPDPDRDMTYDGHSSHDPNAGARDDDDPIHQAMSQRRIRDLARLRRALTPPLDADATDGELLDLAGVILDRSRTAVMSPEAYIETAVQGSPSEIAGYAVEVQSKSPRRVLA